MELALYCPDYGYYEREKDIFGRQGDYYTNVSVGRLYGELLAEQFAAWREEAPGAGSEGWQIVEAGAHDGRLAADILEGLRANRPELFDSVEYCIVEPSKVKRQWQAETLLKFCSQVRWADEVSQDGGFDEPGGFKIIFSNELLDAMPVHRLGWDAQKREWFEW